jgi:DNA-binding transcriptional LysR family regulator
MTSVISLVAAEMGVSVVPWSMTQVMKMEGVAYVPVVGEAPIARMALAMRRDSRVVAARNFAALATSDIRRACPVGA